MLRLTSALFGAILLAAASAVPVAAQQLQTGFAQFGQDNQSPIEIEADELEVQDRQNTAVFAGNVVVTQSGASLQTARLTVIYGASALPQTADASAAAQAPETPQNQRIARLEAQGGVLITSEGQSATGDQGVVDFDSNTLELTGDVTLTESGNVVTGNTLTVDLNTGIARMRSSGRVRVLLNPGG